MSSTSSSFPDSDESQGLTTIMNNQSEGVENDRDHVCDSGNPNQNGATNERFVPITLLDYTTPQATDKKGLIRLPRLTGEPPNYGASIISIL
jgi:hypothetical protein